MYYRSFISTAALVPYYKFWHSASVVVFCLYTEHFIYYIIIFLIRRGIEEFPVCRYEVPCLFLFMFLFSNGYGQIKILAVRKIKKWERIAFIRVDGKVIYFYVELFWLYDYRYKVPSKCCESNNEIVRIWNLYTIIFKLTWKQIPKYINLNY